MTDYADEKLCKGRDTLRTVPGDVLYRLYAASFDLLKVDPCHFPGDPYRATVWGELRDALVPIFQGRPPAWSAEEAEAFEARLVSFIDAYEAGRAAPSVGPKRVS